MNQGQFTYTEIISQPDAWAEALVEIQTNKPGLEKALGGKFDQVIFTGCGSTYYLALAAAALFQKLTGRPARAVPGGELLLNPTATLTDGPTLLVAISRSGSTSETVKAVQQFKKTARGPVVVITNCGDQPLAGLADVPIVIAKGQEQSVAQTRSFASMYVAATALSALAAGEQDLRQAMQLLPACGEKIIRDYAPLAKEIGENLSLDRFYFLGSGERYGLACEVNLKMKEMTLTHSEPFHFLEFRHGPMSMVRNTAAVIGLLSDTNRVHEQKVLDEMKLLGGQIVSLGESDAQIAFNSGVPEAVRNVLYLPALQLMAYFRAQAKGLDPDHPTNLSQVIKLSL